MKIPHNLIGSNLVQASVYKEVMNQNMYRLFKKTNAMKNTWIVSNEASLNNEMTNTMILFIRNS